MSLKNCPFCGEPGVVSGVYQNSRRADNKDDIPENAKIVNEYAVRNHTLYIYKPMYYVAQCSDPSCIGRLRKAFPTREEAEKAWNTRYEYD